MSESNGWTSSGRSPMPINLTGIPVSYFIENDDKLFWAKLVPHRNEMSETVGYKINSTNKSVIYIPDIDSWEKWDTSIIDIVRKNDLLFLFKITNNLFLSNLILLFSSKINGKTICINNSFLFLVLFGEDQ